ncbi:MAG: DUF5686 family protein, partial [Cryomorphaceae bacterium]|nr:DUF5686 family protein [Cryomorphaceae bacterium]
MRILLFLLISSIGFSSVGQRFLKGTVLDEKKNPIPYAKVYVKNDPSLRTVSDVGGYFEMGLMPGEYYLVVTATGYEDREYYLGLGDVDVSKTYQLFPPNLKDIEDVVVSVKKSNPGREIMLRVVNKRDSINPWNYPHTVDVYIKASEKLEFPPKEKQKKEESEERPFEEPTDTLSNRMNLVEVQMNRSYAPPNKVKEIRNAFDLYGNAQNLYYTTTVKSNFNFFENLLHLDDLHETPVSSPISIPGILSYKYRLEEKYEENGQMISRIKIIPRNTATTTLEGYIWIIDSLWLVKKLSLTMNKGNLLIYDHFEINQEFEHPGDTLCVLTKQTLNYGVKYKSETSNASTTALFSNYNFKPNFPAKFFNTEVAVTEQSAYEKDSTFWGQTRAIGLSEEEKRFIFLKDSITEAHNKKEYLDSVDAVFNKITALKILWFGVEHRNRAKKQQFSYGSLATMVQPIGIGGPRIAPNFGYFKKWENQRTYDFYTRISYGFLNRDPKGVIWNRYRFDPFHQGEISASISHEFDVIRGYDAITQIYRRNNFIEATQLNVGINYELVNGLYAGANLNFAERRSLTDFKFLELADEFIPNDSAMIFDPYQASIVSFDLSFVPKQRYMREPYRKVVLGSAWPTLSIYYKKGVSGLFGSDINYDYVSFAIQQNLKLGLLGNTSYRLLTGTFLTIKDVREPDLRYQRRSDPIWFSNPLYSFQGLDTTLPTKSWVHEAHFVHHDNGAILNKIPFMKKTRIGLVIGGGAMYVQEHNYQHYELLAGLERNFKIFRSRLRIGIYGCASDGNKSMPHVNYKVSFAFLD